MSTRAFALEFSAAMRTHWLPPGAAQQQPLVGAKVKIATAADLDAYLLETFGVVLPNTKVCPNHTTPWRAFHDAYFARSPVSVWKASRGFGGKSFTLSLLGMVEAITLKADVNVLGGSGEQSERVLQSMTKLWSASNAPRQFLSGEAARKTKFIWGNTIQALMASQKSVRGPHPQRLRLDEIDEMDIEILNSAMGQPMSARGVLSQTVMSSTHQYPDGTMTQILKRASEKAWPVYEWCWKETCEPHGWLTIDEIARKRTQVTDNMWNTEYDLQEPSAEGRAIVTEAVDRMFDPALGDVGGDVGAYLEFEPPVKNARYATGADWARKTDFTEIGTLRVDVEPARLVAYERLQRQPWPQMVGRFDARLQRYPGNGCHDGTGLGDVVHSLITENAEPFLMVGRGRQDLLSNYIKAVEEGAIRCPRIQSIYSAHKFATYDDVYGSGHLPDPIAMMALAWRACTGGAAMGFLAYAREQVEAHELAQAAPAVLDIPAADAGATPDARRNPWLDALPGDDDPNPFE